MKLFYFFALTILWFVTTNTSENMNKDALFSNLQKKFLEEIEKLNTDRSQDAQELVLAMHQNLFDLALRQYQKQQINEIENTKNQLIIMVQQSNNEEQRAKNLAVIASLNDIQNALQRSIETIESIFQPFFK